MANVTLVLSDYDFSGDCALFTDINTLGCRSGNFDSVQIIVFHIVGAGVISDDFTNATHIGGAFYEDISSEFEAVANESDTVPAVEIACFHLIDSILCDNIGV